MGGIDFTQKGGFALQTRVLCDVTIIITFTVYTSEYEVCKISLTNPGNGFENLYILNYSDFSGNCNFANVGAIEVFVEANSNFNLQIFSIAAVTTHPTSSTPAPFLNL